MFVIAGFIYSKQKQAEKAHKKLNIVVHSYLLESRMPEYELVRVLGILIDNALEAISEHDSMTLHLDSRDGRIIITTLNKGPLLTPEIRAKLFTAGYTTKTLVFTISGVWYLNIMEKYIWKTIIFWMILWCVLK